MLPSLMQSALFAYAGASPFRGFVESFARLTRGLPNGLFDNGAIASYLSRLFGKPGRTDDFRKLKHQLFIVAADLDTGKATAFGAPGFDHVPISEAVKASSALPGLYPPARIDGRDYVDGALKKTLHASVALKEGAKLLVCVNPLVPYDADLAAEKSGGRPRPLAERGLVTVLSQTFRSLIHSRMRVGMERYKTEFPDADVVLFEPARDDEVIFFANIFSYGDRRRLAEHAYRHTLSELERRVDELEPIFARHGVAIDRAALKGRLPRPGKAHQETAGQTGRLWDSVRPLETALGDLEKALHRDKPG
jgi:predicted acylesterase/phospholipase RssA